MSGKPGRWSNINDAIHDGDSRAFVEDSGTGSFNVVIDGTTVQTWLVAGPTFPTGVLDVGVDDTQRGIINVYGHGAATREGGSIKIYSAADHDTVLDYMELWWDQDDFEFAPNGNSALEWNGHISKWIFFEDVYFDGATLDVGELVSDVDTRNINMQTSNAGAYAKLRMSADLAGTQGAQIQMDTSNDYDTAIENYFIDVLEDDLRIGPDTVPTALVYSGGSNQWEINAPVYTDQTVKLAGNVDLSDGTVYGFGIGTGTAAGELSMLGQVTGSVEGGKLHLNTAVDHDTTYTRYTLEASSDTLVLKDNLTNVFLVRGGGDIEFTRDIYLDAVTLDAGEGGLNVTAGAWTIGNNTVEVSASELNTLSGGLNVTAGEWTIGNNTIEVSASELNTLYNVTPGAVAASKVVVVDASRNLSAATGSRINNLTIDGDFKADDISIGGDTLTIGVDAPDAIYIKNYANDEVFIVDGDQNCFHYSYDGAAELYHAGVKKFETTATGATITGELIAGQVTGLNAPNAAGEAVRTTTNITEANLLALTGGGATTLHSHAWPLGDVVGPGSSIDNAITLFNLTTGKLIKESAVTITSGVIAGVGLALTSPIINTILTAATKTGATFTEDGAAELYYAGSKKLETTATGAGVLSDSLGIEFGAGNDADIIYDGDELVIRTDKIAASDLVIDCGTEKTLVLTTPVWEDAVVPMAALRLGGANPAGEIAYRGGIAAEFVDTSDNYVYMTIQLPHSYKEGTDIELHLHWTTNGNGAAGGAGTENIGWIATSSASSPTLDGSEFWPAQTTHAEVIVDVNAFTQHDHWATDIATISGIGMKASECIIISFHRNTGVANNSSLHAIVVSADAHFQKDTIGSRTEYAK